MPLLRGSIIDVISANADINYPIHRSLHTYMINFGDSPVNLVWEYDGKVFENTVNPDDSVYLKPFVKCAFGNPSGGNARMFVVGISGSVTLQAQRELSSLADPVRAINELEPWFKT